MSSTLALQPNVIGVVNAQIAPVTANSSTAYTIGTVLPLPQLKQLTVTVKSIEKEAIAGFTLVDSFTIKQAYDVKFENVNIPLDVMAAINGATLLQNGTAPSQINSVVDASTDVPILFNLSFDTTMVNNNIAEFAMELFCVKGLLDVQVKADDYWICSFTGKAQARQKDGQFRVISALQTAETFAVYGADTLSGGY